MVQETWIETAQGRLFAKRWEPVHTRARNNEPIVLFHDSLGCVDLWRDFPARLAQVTDRTVIAYDRLGFGRSDPYPGTLASSFVSDEAAGSFLALLEQMKLERFVLFGHSVGGGMAVACAAAFPGKCSALITESAQAFVEDRTIEGILEAKKAFQQEGQLDRLKKYHDTKAAWVLRSWIDTWLSEDFRRWNLDESLPLVRCPVLAIHGEGDEYGSTRHPERMVSLVPGHARAEILPGCGHVPHREKESAVLDAVRVFLSE